MSKILSQHKCPIQGHDPSMLDQVCMDSGCQNRGLICEKCVAQSHQNHYKIPLSNFIDQYKEVQGLSNIEQQMDIDTKNLQSMQTEIKGHLQSFMKTMQDEVTKTLERLQSQFDSDVQQLASMKVAEQRYSQIVRDIERKSISNAQESQRKVLELVSRVQLQPNNRFQLFSVSEDGFQKIRVTLRNTMSAKENVYNETTKIAKDTQRYLDGVYRFLSSTLQKGNPNYNQPLHGATFGQFPNNSNRQNNEPDQFHLTSDLNPPTSIISPANNSQVGQRNFQNNNSSGYNFNNRNNNSFYNEPGLGINNNNLNSLNNIDEPYNGQLNPINSNYSPQNQFGGNRNNTSRQYASKPIFDPLDSQQKVKQLHEFERNNENIFIQQQQRGNNRSHSPFREEIHISNSPIKSFAPNRSKTNNYFANGDQHIADFIPNNNNDLNGYPPQQNLMQDSNFERSYSLTNNVGKANTQTINTAHNQYFSDAPSPNLAMNRNNFSNVEPASGYNSINQHQRNLSYPATNSNRVWWKSHEAPIRDIVFIDNDKIASASDDTTIKIWEKIEGKLLTTLVGHSKIVTCLAYHPSGRILASGSADKTIKIWRPVPTWQCVHTFKGHTDTIRALSFLNDRSLFSGSLDGSIKVWDIEKGIFIRSLENGLMNKVHCMLMLQNKCLLVGYERQICAWDLRNNQIMKKIDAHNGPVVRLIFVKGRRNDQPLILSAGRDSSVKIWEASTLIFLRSFEETYLINDLVYLSDSDSVAVSLTGQRMDGKIGIWNLNNMRKIRDIIDNQTPAYRLLYDENYRLLYSCHENRLVEYSRIQM